MQRRPIGLFFLGLGVLLSASLGLNLISASSDAACCYFAAKDKDINQPGQKAFISWNPIDKAEAFTVQPKFEGNAVDFGMVIPTPAKPKLDEMPRDFFKDLALYTILMPLPQPIYPSLEPVKFEAMCMSATGVPGAALYKAKEGAPTKVRVLESGVVGSLDYKIIVADDANGLFQWLKENKYSYGGDEDTLDFYIKQKWFFTVMKIDPNQMKRNSDGSYVGEVTPTRFTFSSKECIYPLKITQLSVKDKTDALFYVQAPQEMDLTGDFSWRHSFRPMYLTYILGCGATPEEQTELQSRTSWLQDKRKKDHGFETTKLEWARKLQEPDMRVLENPEENYAQMGSGDLPPGAAAISVSEFLSEVENEYLKKHKSLDEFAKTRLANMSDKYQPAKGMIVRLPDNIVGKRYFASKYSWYPAREVPRDDVKGLTRLKGHLQKNQWLTKFRRQVRKEEMTQDLVLAEVPESIQQSYIRIMPTSPP